MEEDPKWFYPSCRWTAEQERDFIRDHLGPAFQRHGLTDARSGATTTTSTRSLAATIPGIDYPRTILTDPQAARFVDGVAFHGYAGEPSGMSVFHQEFPTSRFTSPKARCLASTVGLK